MGPKRQGRDVFDSELFNFGNGFVTVVALGLHMWAVRLIYP